MNKGLAGNHQEAPLEATHKNQVGDVLLTEQPLSFHTLMPTKLEHSTISILCIPRAGEYLRI